MVDRPSTSKTRRRLAVLLTTWWVAVGTAAGVEPPSAYDLLDNLRQRYAGLSTYGDRGQIEHCRGEVCRHYVFETSSDGRGGFTWRLRDRENEAQERVVWSDGETTYVYDRTLDQHRPVASPLVELALGLGEVGYDALVVPALLTGGASALEDPEGAAVDGPEPCPGGDGSCWLLSLARMAGAMESYLWVDVDSLSIRRVESLLSPVLGASLGGAPVRMVVDHQPSGRPPTTGFAPPPASRPVDHFTALEESRDSAAAAGGEPFGFVDEITVDLVTVQVRLVDTFGEPLKDIEAADLRATVGGDEVPISHVDWVVPGSPLWGSVEPTPSPMVGKPSSEAVSQRDPDPARWDAVFEAAEARAAPPASRLVILFVQADFEPSRVRGHLRLLPLVRELIDGLDASDRLALLTFDSHLRLWHDLTTDHGQVADLLFDAVRPGGVPLLRPPKGDGPFLRPTFDPSAGRQVADAETALEMTAKALIPLSGRKEIIFLGWGLGMYRGGTVQLNGDYRRALTALQQAQATVSVLDVTEADWHALELGLRNVALNTGGTYQRTLHFASQATRRLGRQLQGYYLVYLDRGALPKAQGRVRIRLRRGPGEALHPPVSWKKR